MFIEQTAFPGSCCKVICKQMQETTIDPCFGMQALYSEESAVGFFDCVSVFV